MTMHTHSYRNRLVVVYNISCGPGRLAFYNITSLDLDPQLCNGRYVHYPLGSNISVYHRVTGLLYRCVDYVEVDMQG